MPTSKANATHEGGLGHDPHGAAGLPEGASQPSSDVILATTDLIKDSNGEVVLFNDSQFGSLELRSDSVVVGQGLVDRHVTEAGDDVSGFRYVAFANGLTLYYDPGLRVTVRSAQA